MTVNQSALNLNVKVKKRLQNLPEVTDHANMIAILTTDLDLSFIELKSNLSAGFVTVTNVSLINVTFRSEILC